jgi:hypothetical protein
MIRIKEIQFLSTTRLHLLLCVALGFCTSGFAQTNSSTLRSSEAYLQELQVKTATVFEKESAKNLSALLYAKQEALYVGSQAVQLYGTKPRVVFVSLADLNQLSTVVAHQNNVELIQIRVDAGADFKQFHSNKQLASFKNLKYLHFVLPDAASRAQLDISLAALDLPYELMYTIQNVDHD